MRKRHLLYAGMALFVVLVALVVTSLIAWEGYREVFPPTPALDHLEIIRECKQIEDDVAAGRVRLDWLGQVPSIYRTRYPAIAEAKPGEIIVGKDHVILAYEAHGYGYYVTHDPAAHAWRFENKRDHNPPATVTVPDGAL